MFNRLYWVAISYLTRPLYLWLVVGGAIFAPLMLINVPPRTSVKPTFRAIPAPNLRIDSAATLKSVRNAGLQNQVDAIDLFRLWTDVAPRHTRQDPVRGKVTEITPLPDESFYHILDEFPHLRTVTNWANCTERLVPDRIARLPELENLSLSGCVTGGLSPLRAARNLRRLELDFILSFDGIPHLEGIRDLAELPHLETIVFRTGVVNDRMLAELAELPHLKTLVLLFPNSITAPIYVTHDGFAALARSPGLRDLRVGSYVEQERQPLLAMARAALPDVPIREAVVDTHEAVPLFALMSVLILPAMGLGVQLYSQFRGPASRLMPGFAAPHALVGSVLAVGLVVLMAARLIWEPGASVAGSILLPSTLVSVVLACTASIAAARWYQIEVNRRLCTASIAAGRWYQIEINRRLAIAVSLFLPITPVGLSCAMYSQTLRQRLLAANDPVTVIILVFIVAASSTLTIWMLNRLVDWASQAGLDDRSLPKGIFLWGQQTHRIEPEPPSDFVTRFFARQERQIEELSKGGEPLTTWGKIQRWRLGNAAQWPFFLVSLVSLIALLIPGLVTSKLLFGTWFNATSLKYIAFLYLAMFGSMVGARWRSRTQVLPLEILRPTSRASLQREWMWALLLDVVPCTISFAAIESVVLNYVPPLGMVWFRLPLDFLLLLPLGMCIAAGLASMVVLIRRTWLLALLGNTLFILTVLANAWARSQFGSSNILGPLNNDGLDAFVWFPSLIGLGAAWVMARRWRKLEIGAVF